MREKRIVIVLMILTIVFTLFGSTLAYWNWTTEVEERTNIVFTLTQDFSCAVDGGGDITETDTFIAPTSCTDSNHAIKREVKVTPRLDGNNLEVSLDLWINVNSMGSGLSNSQNFKYALTTSDSSCTEGVKLSGSFNGATVGSKFNILNDVLYTESTTDTYYLYIWLDSAETSTSTMDQKFNLSLGGECIGEEVKNIYQETILNGAEPVLTSGMIPVTISNDGIVTTADLYSDWYSYENKEWANAVLVNDTSRSSYYESDGVTIKPNQTIPEGNILAYYVWIPSYSYTMNGTEQPISIAFNNTPTDYIEHPAFDFDGQISGFWVGKFETSANTDSTCYTASSETNCLSNKVSPRIVPNVKSLRYQNVSNRFATSQKFSASGNIYGLSNTSTNAHMMKNSEWGAVAYLSHSKYGVNQEIYINNSSNFITGRSGGNVGSDSLSSTTYGNYTWLGQSVGTDGTIGSYASDRTLGTNASTTGNVTGVYDMSGGAWEYVMGVLADSSGNPRSGYSTSNNSGFNGLLSDNTSYTSGVAFPAIKYFDLYETSNSQTACNGGPCYGHALGETANWYADYAVFVISSYPWFMRGGDYDSGASAGVFGSGNDYGDADDYSSWRSVLAPGVGA